MSLVASDAVVLHVMPYSESSRILRLATRELGVVSVLARGARKAQKRFGSAVDLFAGGEVQFYAKPGRDLHTLGAFDVTRARLALGLDLDRFAGAAAIAELVLRLMRDEMHPTWYEALVEALDELATAPTDAIREATLAGAWRLVAALGVTPALDDCALCHDPVPVDRAARFSHPAGGSLCERCARLGGGRLLPAEARATLRAWMAGAENARAPLAPLDDGTVRAHQRLLREFLREHLTEERPLRAYEAWETGRWAPGAMASAPVAGEAPL